MTIKIENNTPKDYLSEWNWGDLDPRDLIDDDYFSALIENTRRINVKMIERGAEVMREQILEDIADGLHRAGPKDETLILKLMLFDGCLSIEIDVGAIIKENCEDYSASEEGTHDPEWSRAFVATRLRKFADEIEKPSQPRG